MKQTPATKNYLIRGRLGNRLWKNVLTTTQIIDKAKTESIKREDDLGEKVSLKEAVNYLNTFCYDYYLVERYYGVLIQKLDQAC
jgi:hypothetical protein